MANFDVWGQGNRLFSKVVSRHRFGVSRLRTVVSARPVTRQHKSVWLLGLASGARVSELHALSTREDCLHFSPDGSVTILPFPGCVAKLQSARHQQISLRPLISNRVLCPVESLRSYLNMTKEIRGDNLQLFLSLGNTNSRISPQGISLWIINTIVAAYKAAACASSGVSASESMTLTPMVLPSQGAPLTVPPAVSLTRCTTGRATVGVRGPPEVRGNPVHKDKGSRTRSVADNADHGTQLTRLPDLSGRLTSYEHWQQPCPFALGLHTRR